jgi:hypothetical protein
MSEIFEFGEIFAESGEEFEVLNPMKATEGGGVEKALSGDALLAGAHDLASVAKSVLASVYSSFSGTGTITDLAISANAGAAAAKLAWFARNKPGYAKKKLAEGGGVASWLIDIAMVIVTVVDVVSNGYASPETGTGFKNAAQKLIDLNDVLMQAQISESDWTGQGADQYASVLQELRGIVTGLTGLDSQMATQVARQATHVSQARGQNSLNFATLMIEQDMAYYLYLTPFWGPQLSLAFQVTCFAASMGWLTSTEAIAGNQADAMKSYVSGMDSYSTYKDSATKIANMGDAGQSSDFFYNENYQYTPAKPGSTGVLYVNPEALFFAAGNTTYEMSKSDQSGGSRGLYQAETAAKNAASAYTEPIESTLHHGLISTPSVNEFSRVNKHRHDAVIAVQSACTTLCNNLIQSAQDYYHQEEVNQGWIEDESSDINPLVSLTTPAPTGLASTGSAQSTGGSRSPAGASDGAAPKSAEPQSNPGGATTGDEQLRGAASAQAASTPQANISDAGGSIESPTVSGVALGMQPAGLPGNGASRSAPPGSSDNQSTEQAFVADTLPTASDVDDTGATPGTQGSERVPVNAAAGHPETESAPTKSPAQS